ncbi:MAG TPA: septal ring lytic transglycosylase RlpA family protein [Solirubrobacteraceae bacterium]|nr:septal ring lytic transglycosylase RlpA family protein [Solirubrobacteraceae bacterium]
MAVPAELAIAAPARTALHARITDPDVLVGQPTQVKGRLSTLSHALERGRPLKLEVLRRHGWRTVARTHTGRGGRFRLSYTPRALGTARLRVVYGGQASLAASHVRLHKVTSFREVIASWYGGGGSLACGGELTSATLGVANKTLPCGTMVTLRYDGRTVRVPVVDRGPFVAGREFDLTEATRNALGFAGVAPIWSSR